MDCADKVFSEKIISYIWLICSSKTSFLNFLSHMCIVRATTRIKRIIIHGRAKIKRQSKMWKSDNWRFLVPIYFYQGEGKALEDLAL